MDMTEHLRTEADDEPRMRADARRSRAKLLEAATAAFAENGADAPLEDIARRAGVGIGTLYRHFPTRTDLQAGVFRSQVDAVCATADELIGAVSPQQAFAGSVRAIAGYLITKRGLARALVDSLGKDSELISACSLRMRDTLDRLLAHAQQAGVLRPDRQAVPIDELVGHRVRRLTHLFSHVTVTDEVPAGLPLVDADYSQIDQVVTNLLENAARHSPPGTTIEIGASAGPDAVEVWVADRGPGVDLGQRDELFEPFRRGPGSDSSGIGLAICRAIIDAHGGSIDVRNRPDGGAVFEFTLPVRNG